MWRRMSNSSSSSYNGGAMEMVSIVWHNPLLTGAVILLLTPPFYPLLVYFSPLLVSTALCVAALLSIGPQMEKLQAQREVPNGVSDRHRGPQDAGAWIRVSDIVNADSVTSTPGFAAQRYEHLAEWSGQSEVRRVWSSGDTRSAQQPTQQGGAAEQSGTTIASKLSEEDRWAAWVKEYEARPEWNEATAPPSQDGGFAAAVKREQEMRREKECLKLEKDKLKERFKLAAIEAKLQRRHATQSAEEEQQQAHMKLVVRKSGERAHVGGVEERHVSEVETLERFLFMDTDLSIAQGQRTSSPACRTVDSTPPKIEVPTQVLHQLKTAGLGGLGRLKVRCSPGTNAAAHGDAASAAGTPGSNSRSSGFNSSTIPAPLAEAFARKYVSAVENEVKTSGQEQQVRTATEPSSRVSTPTSRGKQLSPGMLHILKTAGLGSKNGKESLEAADTASDEATKKSSAAGGQRVAAESRESSSDEQLESDDESEEDASEYSELRKHLMESRSQISESKQVTHNLLRRSRSCYKGSDHTETGKLQRAAHLQGTQKDTPDNTSRKLQIASANSQAFQQHYTFKTDCNTSENSSNSSSATTTRQAKDKGIIALGRSHSTCRQLRLRQVDPSARNSELHSSHKSLSRSSSLRAASISSLDDSRSCRRNSTPMATLKPLVWKSRPSNLTEESDATI